MLVIFLSPPLYTDFIRLPKVGDIVPDYILDNPKLFPFFEDALGAMDGSHFHLLPPIKMPCTIAMALSQPTPWLFVTLPCDFSIPRVAGKDLLLMPRCFTIPVSPISVFLMGSTSLQMQGSQPAPPYSFHIVAHDTIFLNGVVHSYSMYHLLLQLICHLYFTGPPPEKNYSTYNMPGLGTSLREHSGWSSGASRSWSSNQNILWMYRHEYFLPSEQFTTVSLKGMPLRSLIYYPHLMMALMLKIVVSLGQSIQGRQRKTELMPDAIRLQRVCGMIIRECFEGVICSCIVLSPNDITLCIHCFTVQNTKTKTKVSMVITTW